MNIKRLLRLFVYLLSITLLTMYLLSVFINWKSTQPVWDFPEIKEKKLLNVVTGYDSTSFHADDSVAAFQYGLCQFIAQRSGLSIQFYFENDLETATKKLEKNEYDVIAQNIPVTKANKQILAFTVPVAQGKQVLVQRKSNAADSVLFIANQLDLAGQTIYVRKNSPAVLRLTHLAEEIAEPIYIKEIGGCSPEQLIDMVDNKEIDYSVVDNEIALKNAPLFPNLDFNTDISFTQLQAWALRKTSPVLLDSLNIWITAFKKNSIENFNRKKE